MSLRSALQFCGPFPVSTALFLEYRQRALRGEIGRDAKVELLLPDGTTYPKKGTINFVSSDVSAGTDTITVRAEFENPTISCSTARLFGSRSSRPTSTRFWRCRTRRSSATSSRRAGAAVAL
ncbi:RND efflux system, membrane fusion protein CmeA [Sinorhizobium sp. CCBAU 05631]|nr:hypothetical protein [Sinorhizobium sp. CCBAU 05631]ASY57051.1 RND efflux system, membrane fusion protein CmeA [Sinorhizobium sp. CCBAU 05631]